MNTRVNLRGDGTRADVRRRLAAFLDQYHADFLRQFATRLVLEDVTDVEDALLQVRAELARNRRDVLAQFERACDEMETAS
jgi:hypothetical protein